MLIFNYRSLTKKFTVHIAYSLLLYYFYHVMFPERPVVLWCLQNMLVHGMYIGEFCLVIYWSLDSTAKQHVKIEFNHSYC